MKKLIQISRSNLSARARSEGVIRGVIRDPWSAVPAPSTEFLVPLFHTKAAKY